MVSKTTLFFLSLFLLVACRSQVPPTPTFVPPTPSSVPLQTGVHLQSTFPIPEAMGGTLLGRSQMDYLLYLPDEYASDSDRVWPLILFLHGSGSETYDSSFVLSYGLPEVLLSGDQPDPFPFIVVSPQIIPGTTWWNEEVLTVLGALVDEVVATYQVDDDRVYLTGLSMGGYGSWHLADEYPDRFAAMISISGSGFRTRTLPEANAQCRLGDVPIWGIHGELDQISAPSAARLFLGNLEAECGGKVKKTFYPDTGHFETYARAYRDPQLYTWLLEHSLADR